ncbi:hypothetical protein OH460_08640 [Vibrio sp. Makdt]|uniref:hypothetical protein n=1 Tax=Vibrio sp. Makdt TaxID=2998828 RepID=UPI0022CD24C4|nr:hypothetical protein [Vibrio sp. Makdt]MDA0152368.1 hypothetical protein [Vibrio sp. Makdt]
MQNMFEIIGDGKTVWVNNINGDCIARFGVLGIDIHTSSEEQINGAPQCLFCTHERTDVNDWVVFKDKVKELFDIDVPEKLSPFAAADHTSPQAC